MRLPTHTSLRVERLAIISAVTLILAVFIATGAWFAHERRLLLRDQGYRAGGNLAHVLKQQVAGSMRAIDLTLSHIVDTLRLLPPLPEHDPAFEEALRRKLPRLPYVRALFVIGPDGFITQDTDPSTPHTNLADRGYFKAHVNGPMLDLYISPPLLSRSTGTWFVSLSRRITRRDGSFGGIAVAALEVQRFEAFYRALELGPTDSVTLFLRDGTLLLRTPTIDKLVGRRLSDLPLFATHLPRSPTGSFEAPSLDDGMSIVSYRAVDGYPLVVAVTLSEHALLAGWHRNTLLAAAAALGFAAAVVLLTTVFVRSRRRYERLYERQLRAQHLETLGRMTGGIAHDINNLLATVESGTRLLGRIDALDREKSVQILDQLSGAVARGRALMAQLLSFAKRQALDVRPINVNERLERLKPLLRQAAQNVEISIDLAKGLWPCQADPAQFDAAILNLVVNARDAMPAGGVVKISTRNLALNAHASGFSVPADKYVEVRVTDTGEGMPPEIARQAIEPFFSTKGESGTGLGLSQVYGFVRQVGGDLKIESKPGAGTTVHLLFQRATGSGATTKPSEADDAARATPSNI